MVEISKIADELRDEVLQTMLAVRLNLAHAIAHDDCPGVLMHAAQAREHLEAEAGRIRGLVERLEAIAEQLEPLIQTLSRPPNQALSASTPPR